MAETPSQGSQQERRRRESFSSVQRYSQQSSNVFESNSQSQTQTQTEFMTQNEMTQIVEEDSNSMLSPIAPPQSPINLRLLPWGRLIPCSKHWSTATQSSNLRKTEFGGGIDLLPRAPSSTSTTVSSDTAPGTDFLGLEGLKSSDIFNEYTLGRSIKCDVVAVKPPPLSPPPPPTSSKKKKKPHDEPQQQVQDWAHAMISNRHCRIYCMLKTNHKSNNTTTSSTPPDMEIYIEDTSGNGTLINHTTHLRRGETRLLHTGDEISLVHAATLRKKIHSKEVLHTLQKHHSFIFVNLFQQQGQQHRQSHPMGRPSSLSSLSAPIVPQPRVSSASRRRRGAVDVRSTHHHSLSSSSPRPPVLQSSSSSPPPDGPTNGRRSSPRRAKPRRIQEEYDIRDVLGSGTCGQVRRAIHRRTGQEWAVKIIPLAQQQMGSSGTDNLATLEAEASLLQTLNHPYVVQLADVFVAPGVAVYIVMELVHGGDLFDRIVSKGKYTEVESRRVLRRLLNAVFYLHETKNIVHRDLKPENILCGQSDIEVKLTDFGLAKSVTDEGLKTFCGTPQYFAPEVLKRRHTVAGRGRYGKQADMWSLGVILYILLSGSPPFDVTDAMEVGADTTVQFPADRWQEISDSAKDLVQQLLRSDPRRRISVQDACLHSWILTEDGDTHTYPLDDPVTSTVYARKRLFSLEEASVPPAGASSDSTAASTAEATSDDKPPADTTHPNSDKVESKEKVSEIHDDDDAREAPLPGPSGSPSRETPDVDFESQQSDQAVVNNKDEDIDEEDSPAAVDRDPLLVLSLNERGNKFRDIVARSVEKNSPSLAEGGASVDVSNGNRNKDDDDKMEGILVTPKMWEVHSPAATSSATVKSKPAKPPSSGATSKAKGKRQRKQAVVSETKAAELTEDEICSQFSDDESISSFPSEKANQDKASNKADKPVVPTQTNTMARYLLRKTEPPAKDAAAATTTSKRKRAASTDANETTSHSGEPGVAKKKCPYHSGGESPPEAEAKSPEAKAPPARGKQTKLSTWFRKKS